MKKLPAESLKWHFPFSKFNFRTSDDSKALSTIIGQKDALDSIKMGLKIKSHGYNIFITGMTGTGKKSSIYKFLKKNIKNNNPDLEDILYFYNFNIPEEPISFKVKSGEGIELKRSFQEFISNFESFILSIFESEYYIENLLEQEKKQKKEEDKIFKKINKFVTKSGFKLIQNTEKSGTIEFLPVINGNILKFSQLNDLLKNKKITKNKITKIKEKKTELEKVLALSMKDIKALKSKYSSEREYFDIITVIPIINDFFEEIKKKTTSEEIKKYLNNYLKYISQNISKWKYLSQNEKNKEIWEEEKKIITLIFSINLIVNNADNKKSPVIIENFPSETNLFGSVETSESNEEIHLNVKAGSFLKAHKGYIVIDAFELLTDDITWQRFKRTLKTGRLEITPIASPYTTKGYLRPNPVEIDVKIILIGKEDIYTALYYKDPEFSKIFKVKVNFYNIMDLNIKNLRNYAKFISYIVKKEKLLPLSIESIGEICEYAVRSAGGRKNISTKFGMLSDLIIESNFWEKYFNPKSKIISSTSVKTAILKKDKRHSSYKKYLFEFYKENILKINLKEAKVGEINGLTIIENEDVNFGFPVRITSTTSPGNKGIISIERESELSGEIHTKAIYIITGFLRGKYAQNFSLSLQASICFEQTYNLVDGDSASIAEICTLLSSITKIPLKQNFAITGSMDQFGNVQSVGGINEKIEGFFEICNLKKVKNSSVIIPEDNVKNLQLGDKIIKAVKKNEFSIYSVSNLDEVLKLILKFPNNKNINKISDFHETVKTNLYKISQKVITKYIKIGD